MTEYPCENATAYEIARNEHLTSNEDGICDQCLLVLSIFERRRVIAESLGEDYMLT